MERIHKDEPELILHMNLKYARFSWYQPKASTHHMPKAVKSVTNDGVGRALRPSSGVKHEKFSSIKLMQV